MAQVHIVFLQGIDGFLIIFAAYVISLLHIFKNAIISLCSVIMLTSQVKQAVGYAQGFSSYVAMVGFCTFLESCSQMLLALAVHCWVFHSLGTACHPSLAEDLLLHQHVIHLFLGTVVLSSLECHDCVLFADAFDTAV